MSHLIYVFFFIGLLICNPGGLKAQALNDECNSAIELTNVGNWCSTGTPFNVFRDRDMMYGIHLQRQLQILRYF